MEPDLVFLTGLDRFGAVVHALPADAWDRPSPCEGWTARDVLGHVVAVVETGNAILRGEQPSPPTGPPGAVVGDDPVGRWDGVAGEARQSLVGADLDAVVDSPRGARSIRQGLAFPALDLHLHAWDLGRAGGVDVELEPEVQAYVRALIDPLPSERMRSPGVFGPEQPAPDDATGTERLMAWTGRRLDS